MKRKQTIAILILLSVWFVMSFYKLGNRDLWSAGETRDAQIAQEMIASGDFLIPRFNDDFLPWKPPLFHWTECLASLLTEKHVDSFSSRLPSSLSFLAGALALYLLLAGIATEKTRLMAGLIFLTTYKFSWMSRVAQIDVLFSVLIATACLIFFRFYFFYDSMSDKTKKSYLISFYTIAALSVLAKGPAGAILIGGGIFLFLLMDRNLSFIFRCLSPWGILIFILLGGSWYLALTFTKGREFIVEFFINQNINRFVSAFDHRHPFQYYISQFIGGFMPWTFFFFAAVLSSLFRKKPMMKVQLFSLACFAFIFVFFSVSTSKRGVYILPLYIPAAIMTASYMAGIIDKEYSFSLYRIASFIQAAFFVILGSLFFVFQNDSIQSRIYKAIEHRLSHFDQIMYPKIQLIIQQNHTLVFLAALLLIILGLLLIVLTKRRKPLYIPIIITASMLFVNIFFIHLVIPFFDQLRSLRPFSEKVMQVIAKDQFVYVFGIAPEDLIYYGGKKIIPLAPIEEIHNILPQKPSGFFFFTDTKYIPELDRIKVSYDVLFDTGIKHIDGVLIKIKPGL